MGSQREDAYYTALQRLPRVGLPPFLVRPIRSNDALIFYVNILFPCPLVSKRAWLQVPDRAGDRATVDLESTDMNLGRAGDAPRVRVQSKQVGRGSMINRDTPVVLGMEGVGGSFLFGEAEDRRGILTATTAPLTSSAVVDTTVNPLNFLLKTPRLASVVDTGVKCAVQSVEAQELRAIATGRAPPFALYTSPTSIERVYGTEFYLAWRPVASYDGFPVTFTFVTQSVPGAPTFNGISAPQSIFSRQSNTVLAGQEWAF